MNDVSSSQVYYEKAVQANPDNVDAIGSLASFLHGVKKEFERANILYELALQKDPNHLNNLCNFGLFLSEEKHIYDQAEAMFKRALEIMPFHANSLYNYAVMLDTHLTRRPEAEELYRRVLQLDPNHTYALYNLAQLLETNMSGVNDQVHIDSLKKEIQSIYASLIRADPNDAVAYSDFGRFTLVHTSFLKNAEKFLLKAYSIDSSNQVALYYLGLCYYK